jgi:2-oxoglutarate dehydrogenase E1 component
VLALAKQRLVGDRVSLDSLLCGDNAALLDELYQSWLDDPASVDADWAALFEDQVLEPGARTRVPEYRPPSIFEGGRGPAASAVRTDPSAAARQASVAQMINAYRVRGHLIADIDPLKRRDRTKHPELTLAYWGLSEDDLDAPVLSDPLYGEPRVSTLRSILARLEKAYCSSFGVEYMNIDQLDQKLWLAKRLETLQDQGALLTHDEQIRVLEKLADAENFERLIHTKFPGTKRFSLEGGETLIPLLDTLVEDASEAGVLEIILGMAHRGRLNTLVNVMGKPAAMILDEFAHVEQDFDGSGDVKYHLGYGANRVTRRGHKVHLNLAFNPSHLEAVDPVVEGRVRAKQDRSVVHDGTDPAEVGRLCMPLLIHGDAAFAGQGLVAEVLQMSDLEAFDTGGTLHVIVNNQIGFTTGPKEARSTPYASGIARMLGVPIFHVNGEDPEAVLAVARIAVEWRQRFGRDVVIDMLCFRKYGHNEGDEPSFTQPKLYELIRKHPSPREAYARFLVSKGSLSQEEVDTIVNDSRARLIDSNVQDGHDAYVGDPNNPMGQLWRRYTRFDEPEPDTGFPMDRLVPLLEKAHTLPEDFGAHRKIKRLMQQRLAIVRGKQPVDWAVAEAAAYATICVEGLRVRLSGQDCGRGTFSHRHAALTEADVEHCRDYLPLAHLSPDQAPFEVWDSLLSEAGVLGFEFGYSMDYPDALVLWEAQFGDFANGAQVIIDQFITATEQKWNRFSGLVMLLPHGYEGQGPEHSSARIERYLMLAAEDNICLANCTTPANFFHLLRRQALRSYRRPLIVFTPKSLLRHPECVSTMEDLATGSFQPVFGETDEVEDVRRVVLCQGKLYYELRQARRDRAQRDVALIRVDELYPFPAERIAEEVARYPGAEVVWCQEEPRNMGVWPVYCDWLRELLPADAQPRYVGRKPTASPATGFTSVALREQAELIEQALSLPQKVVDHG